MHCRKGPPCPGFHRCLYLLSLIEHEVKQASLHSLLNNNLYPITPWFPLLRLNKVVFEKGLKAVLVGLELKQSCLEVCGWSVGLYNPCACELQRTEVSGLAEVLLEYLVYSKSWRWCYGLLNLSVCFASEKRNFTTVRMEGVEQEPSAAVTCGEAHADCRSDFWCYAGKWLKKKSVTAEKVH